MRDPVLPGAERVSDGSDDKIASPGDMQGHVCRCADGPVHHHVTMSRDNIVADWPPPPHDPRERDLVLAIDGWEVRLFAGRKFQYFVTRGFWHLQLWHPSAGVSVLTPSRLTRGFYEAFPIARWKASAPDYDKLVTLLMGVSPASLPNRGLVLLLERRLVDDVVESAVARREDAQ